MWQEMLTYIIEKAADFTTALSQHLSLSFISLGISLVLGVVFGILSTRSQKVQQVTESLANLGRTLPSLAVLALAIPFIGIGAPPTILALVFIGTLPILVNTSVGISQVDKSIKESARGMGMSDLQILLKVELPIATAVIMAGVRTSAVLVVASATLAAFIGGGGLGDLILRGHALNKEHILLAGAIPATLLAFYFEDMFGRLEEWATPEGLREKANANGEHKTTFNELLVSVLLMPLVFGMLLPWAHEISSEGRDLVLTGIHGDFQFFGLGLLILGILLVFRPRNERLRGRRWIVLSVAIVAIVTILFSLVTVGQMIFAMSAEYVPGTGFYLQSAAAITIAGASLFELRRERRAKAQH